MKNSAPQTIRLEDYKVPDFLVDTIDLSFNLQEEVTVVTAKTKFRRNPKSQEKAAALVLEGEKIELVSLHIDGKELSSAAYQCSEHSLTVSHVPESFELTCVTRCKPQENLTLEGLYKSGGMFCTQCEAQGFRKITYYPDRPDVMASFSTTIIAAKDKYPILLSNGNLVEKKDLENGQHMATWSDPFRKPAYLFALVAGDLGKTEDHFVTRSGRKVKLEIYVDKGNEDRTAHAMASLKKAMKWDEDTFGLEYDLDIFMIVAVDDFNFGAMENKGLNIFNSSLLLAKPTTATDNDYEAIEGVIGHEYFHNWSGNRVTCRDWFQLSLKEGLTVYRDQEFTADMMSRAVKRIDDVIDLRSFQFAEDAGPMSHPIRPSSYIEINNFYTPTVYEKGAEVIRMIATLLGKEVFRKGIDKYFELYDGQAVTTEDFVHAMEVASGVDLSQFRNTWYSQAGTPALKISTQYMDGKYTLEVQQSCQPTPGQPSKKPFHIPLAMALLDEGGRVLQEQVLSLKQEKEIFVFPTPVKPVPSFLRGFSAPVKLHYDYSIEELLFLLSKDTDSYARWEAGQMLAVHYLQNLISKHTEGKPLEVDSAYLEVLGKIVEDHSIDPALRARLLELPEDIYLAQLQTVIFVESIEAAKSFLEKEIALLNEAKFLKVYEGLQEKEYAYGAQEAGKRSLRKVCLQFLVATGKAEHADRALTQLKTAYCMTEEMAAISSLNDLECSQREEASHHFYQKWNKESLVMNKWLALQGGAKLEGGLERIKRIMNDPAFNINNPNKVSSLLLRFGRMNLGQFHKIDGLAYKFFADLVLDIDKRNPSLAARTVSVFNQWKKFDTKRQELMREQLQRIVDHSGISPGVYEIASRALQ